VKIDNRKIGKIKIEENEKIESHNQKNIESEKETACSIDARQGSRQVLLGLAYSAVVVPYPLALGYSIVPL